MSSEEASFTEAEWAVVCLRWPVEEAVGWHHPHLEEGCGVHFQSLLLGHVKRGRRGVLSRALFKFH